MVAQAWTMAFSILDNNPFCFHSNSACRDLQALSTMLSHSFHRRTRSTISCHGFRPWGKVTFFFLIWHVHYAICFPSFRRICRSIPMSFRSNEYPSTASLPSSQHRIIEVKHRLRPVSSQRTTGAESNQSSTHAFEVVIDGDPIVLQISNLKRRALGLLGEGRLSAVLGLIKEMLHECRRERLVEQRNGSSPRIQQMSVLVDDVFQAFATAAFAPDTIRSSKQRHQQPLELGLHTLQLQLSAASLLVHPYETVPRSTLIMALRTLTAYMEVHGNELITLAPLNPDVGSDSGIETSDAAFRILQRLVTGVGVRPSLQKGRVRVIAEKDFHRVLIAISKVGKVSEAHRMVKMQERHAGHFVSEKPAVAYSILIKGYGQLGDSENVVATLTNFCTQLQSRNDVQPDIIFLNSLIDAFINCRAFHKAQAIFDYMKQRSTASEDKPVQDTIQHLSGTSALDETLLSSLFPVDGLCLAPNQRTYNTMLKGFAEYGSINQALSLAYEMEGLGMWDPVTTNTLVHAAVQCGQLELAESILGNYTTSKRSFHMSDGLGPVGFNNRAAPKYAKTDQSSVRSNSSRKPYQHPNVEAYTELLDAYGKGGQLEKAMGVMQLMRKRGVEPNEFTYTCLLGALARHRKVDQAHRVVAYMESSACDVRLTAATYNSFISGLVDSDRFPTEGNDTEFDACVDEALRLLRRMMEKGVSPNAITISLLIESFGRCQRPRVEEAKALMQKLEQDGIITRANLKIATSLIRTCSRGGDLKGAAEAFRRILQPDAASLNAFLDACCRCNMLSLALQTFDHFLQRGNQGPPEIYPDVITYSVVIDALFNSKTPASARRAQQLYNEMKSMYQIRPDRRLVDRILKAMVTTERPGLSKEDVLFLMSVLRDAESLVWEDGQLDRRKRAVRAVLVSRINELGKEKKEILGMLNLDTKGTEDDDLFLRKGWNKVDSSFRLWNNPSIYEKQVKRETKKRRKEVDEFFESKGWNVFSSGFRIF